MKICTPWPRSDTSRIWKSEVLRSNRDRKSTRLNSSHSQISYAVFCLKKKKINHKHSPRHLNHLAQRQHHGVHALTDRDRVLLCECLQEREADLARGHTLVRADIDARC